VPEVAGRVENDPDVTTADPQEFQGRFRRLGCHLLLRGKSTNAIRELIEHNAQIKGLLVKGAVRRGPSLLPEVFRCGHCGRRLYVTYSGANGYVPRHTCRGPAVNHGTDACISFGGLRVDEPSSGRSGACSRRALLRPP
jgi:hypothetical protein